MPNWTTNAVLMHKCDRDKFINAEGNVDFNLLLPLPDSLNQMSSPVCFDAVHYYRGEIGYDDIRQYLSFLPEGIDTPGVAGEDEHGRYLDDDAEDRPYTTMRIDGKRYVVESSGQFRELGRIYVENQEKYGERTAYGWVCTHWGTKWNARSSYILEIGEFLLVTFDTAWAPPSYELIVAMAKAFDEEFIIESVYEDYDGTVYNPETDSSYPLEDSALFVPVEYEDGYIFPAPDDELTEERARSFFP